MLRFKTLIIVNERKSLVLKMFCILFSRLKKEFAAEEILCFDGKLSLGESFQPPGLFQGFEAGFVWGQSLADGAGLLGAEVQRNVLLALKRNRSRNY
jgi:hypothetical protein